MSSQLTQLQDATIAQHCKTLRMPTMAAQFNTLAEQAIREKRTHLGYLDALLTVEIEEREKNTVERRIKEARLPRVKTLEEFDFHQSPLVDAAIDFPAPWKDYVAASVDFFGIATPHGKSRDIAAAESA